MTLPAIVEDALGGEEVATRVSLSGDDEVFVTAARTAVYRAGGVLSDESVEVFDHGVDRLTVSEGRRKATITFEYAVEDDLELSIPLGSLEAAVQPILAAVLRHQGVTDPDERFRSAFRFSELTVVITDQRVLKHVGAALWDGEFDAYHFEAVTDLAYERGDVATGVVLTVDGRKERIKTPNDRLPEVERDLESSLFAYHDVSSADQLPDPDDETATEEPPADDDVVSFGSGVDPLDAGAGPGRIDPEETADLSLDPEATTADATPADAAGPGEPTEPGPEAREGPAPEAAEGSAQPRPDRTPGSDQGSDQSAGTDDPLAGDPDESPSGGGDSDAGTADDSPASTGDAGGPEAATTTASGRADTEREADAAPDQGPQAPERGAEAGDAATGSDREAEGSPTERATPGSRTDESGSTTQVPEEDASDGASTETPFTEDIEPAADPDVADELRDLREAVERQNELLRRQQRAIERLIEELRGE